MKKALIIAFILCISTILVFANPLDRDNKNTYSNCLKNCTLEKTSAYKQCENTYKVENKNCIANNTLCSNLSKSMTNKTLSLEAKKACILSFKECKNSNIMIKKDCKANVLNISKSCRDSCVKPCKNKCGDGICQQVVCTSLNCPCAETNETCPIDCSADKIEKYCKTEKDCACGMKIGTEECFYGNYNYVNTTAQCPDFCTGIAGNLKLRCKDHVCTQVTISNRNNSTLD